MPNRVQWDPRFNTGSEIVDEQHRTILVSCNALADCLADDSEEGGRRFRKTFDELMAFAREHFDAEEAVLAGCGCTDLDDHRNERDEFDYLAAEIITTENFDKDELQTFLALWWTGHIAGAAKKHRALMEQQSGNRERPSR